MNFLNCMHLTKKLIYGRNYQNYYSFLLKLTKRSKTFMYRRINKLNLKHNNSIRMHTKPLAIVLRSQFITLKIVFNVRTIKLVTNFNLQQLLNLLQYRIQHIQCKCHDNVICDNTRVCLWVQYITQAIFIKLLLIGKQV